MGRRVIYVSSTFKDLEGHRRTLKTALERAGYDVESMERYPAFDERPLDKCLQDVAACDAYVLIVAHRYGFRPQVEGKRTLSITEREYLWARHHHKPCFVFCVDENHPWPPKLIDSPRSKDGRSLAALRARVAEAHGLRTFTDPDNLAQQVLAALTAHPWPASAPPPAASSLPFYPWPAAWDFGPYLAQRRKGFVGRAWLFEEVADWLAAGHPRALLVRADFGVGKSAFMAELVFRNPGDCIAAWHFCQHDTQHTLHPGHFVQGVATQLATALPEYKALVEAEPALQEWLNQALDDPGTALEGGVLAPLARLPVPTAPRLLLVDALDESLELDADTRRRCGDIVSLLATRAARFPAWLRVLATTRSNPQVLTPLRDGFAAKLVDAESDANQADLLEYVLQRAAREPLAGRLREAGTAAQALADLVVEKCQGKFLLAERALRALEAQDNEEGPSRLHVEELAALPPGMDSWYLDAFERRFMRSGRDYEPVRDVLGVLVAAREPLPLETIAAVLQVGPDAVKAVYRQLPDFLHLRTGRLAFDHFSIAEWLVREDEAGFIPAGDFAVKLPVAQDRLRSWALAQVEAGKAHLSSYLLRHLASHLIDDDERCGVFARLMLTSFDWLQARLDQDGVNALLSDLQQLVGLPERPLLEAVLLNATHVLRLQPEQLAAQVLGRVGDGLGEKGQLRLLAEAARHYLAAPANRNRAQRLLVPMSPSLRLSMVHVVTLEGDGQALAVLPDGCLAWGSWDGSVRVWDPQRRTEPLVFNAHAGEVRALAVLRDGRLACGSEDGSVRVWDPQRRIEPLVFEGHAGVVRTLAVLPDGRLASGSEDGSVRVWDPQRQTEPLVFEGHAGEVRALAVLRDGRLASGSVDRTVRVWDPQRRTETLVFEGHAGVIWVLAVLPDGRLASGSWDHTVVVWDLQRQAEPLVFEDHTGEVGALTVLPDGRLASGSWDRTVRVWDLQRRAEPLVFKGHTDWVWALAVLPDGRLASGSHDHTVRVWDPQRRAKPLVFEGHAGAVGALAVLPDGRLASGSWDRTVRVWDPQRRAEPLGFEGHARDVAALAVLPNGWLASGSSDGSVMVWDPQQRARPLVFEGHAGEVKALAVLPDGRLACGFHDGTVRVWDPQRRIEPLQQFKGDASGVRALAVLPDGRLASGSDDGAVRVWDPQRRAEPLLFKGHTDWVWTLAVLPDGRLASGSLDGTVRVWDPQRRAEPLVFEGHTRPVRALVVLSDGRLASGAEDGSVRVWDPQRRAEPLMFKGHAREVWALAVLPDGRLASGSWDRTVRVWDPQRRTEPLMFEDHTGEVGALAVLPDGRLASGSSDRTVRVWDLSGGCPLRAFVADSDITCLVATPGGLTVAGCSDGAVHFLCEPGQAFAPV
jgi:WD40 repeat protein